MTDKPSWSDDQLNRKAEGQFLVNYLNELYAESSEDIYQESFVLNLNGPWGQGKTYFLNNLESDLRVKRHPVIHFDAWMNDYSKTPLLGFLSELQQALKIYFKEIPKGPQLQKTFLDNGKKILGTIAGIGTQIVVKQLTGSSLEKIQEDLGIDSETIAETTKQLGEASKGAVEKIVQKSLNEHQELKGLIQSLKQALQDITQSLHNNAKY